MFWRHTFCFLDFKMTGKEPALHAAHCEGSLNSFIPHRISWSMNHQAVYPTFQEVLSSSHGLPESVCPALAGLHKHAPEESQPSLAQLCSSACFQRAALGHGRQVLLSPGKLPPRQRWPPLFSTSWLSAGLEKGLPWSQQQWLGKKWRVVELRNAR